MKTKTFFTKSFLFVSIGLSSMFATAQAILTVDNTSGSVAAYTNIQVAHDAANAGDLIYVQPSETSYGDLTLSKAITIVGATHSELNNRSRLDNVFIQGSNVTLKGLVMNNLFSNPGGTLPYENIEVYENRISYVYIGQGADRSVENVIVQGNQLNGMVQYQNATNILVTNNVFTSSNPIQIYNAPSIIVANNIFNAANFYIYNYGEGTANLTNNMFLSGYPSTSIVSFQGFFNLSNNLFYNYYESQTMVINGANYTESNSLLNIDPQFAYVDTTSGKFAGYNWDMTFRDEDLTLQAGSPALTGGTGGSEIGIFNNFIYNYMGHPRGVPSLTIGGYDGVVPKDGTINVTINAKAY